MCGGRRHPTRRILVLENRAFTGSIGKDSLTSFTEGVGKDSAASSMRGIGNNSAAHSGNAQGRVPQNEPLLKQGGGMSVVV